MKNTKNKIISIFSIIIFASIFSNQSCYNMIQTITSDPKQKFTEEIEKPVCEFLIKLINFSRIHEDVLLNTLNDPISWFAQNDSSNKPLNMIVALLRTKLSKEEFKKLADEVKNLKHKILPAQAEDEEFYAELIASNSDFNLDFSSFYEEKPDIIAGEYIFPTSRTPSLGKFAYTCTTCEKNFHDKTKFLRHTTMHSGEKPFACEHDECKKSFRSKDELRRHTKNIHVKRMRPDLQESFDCSYLNCGKTYLSKDSLKAHILAMHQAQATRYICKICGQEFAWHSNFIRHKKTHMQDKQHVCTKCGASFLTSCDLQRHQRVHSAYKPFVCNQPGCQKCFKSNQELIQHQKYHAVGCNFTCPVCKRKFKTAQTLNTHQKIHNQIKDHVCTFPGCDAAFYTAGDLSRHEKTVHNLENPFKCPYPGCIKAFKLQTRLNEHIRRMHLKERAFKCNDCTLAFITKGELNKHKKRKHEKGEK